MALVTGDGFGYPKGIRISYAASMEDIDEALGEVIHRCFSPWSSPVYACRVALGLAVSNTSHTPPVVGVLCFAECPGTTSTGAAVGSNENEGCSCSGDVADLHTRRSPISCRYVPNDPPPSAA